MLIVSLFSLFIAWTIAEPINVETAPFNLVNETLIVQYGDALNLPSSRVLPLNASLEQPRIGIPTSLVELPLLVIMVDINATRPYVLHWLQTNLQPDRIDTQPSEITFLRGSPNSPPIASYANPRPPAGTGPHRYTLFVFRQPENFTIPPDYASFGNSSRASFNFPDFIAQTGLNMPVAANYFFSENTTVSSQNGTSNSTSRPSSGSGNPNPIPTAIFDGDAVLNKIPMALLGFSVACAFAL